MLRQVLIADDSASHRRIIRTALKQIPDLEIVQAVDGREAIALPTLPLGPNFA